MRRPHQIRRRSAAGFTLVELLIAIFLLALGLTSVFALFPVGMYFTRENVAETRAALLARSALATIDARGAVDRFAAWTILARDADDTVCSLRSGQDGLTPDDVRDTRYSQYCWIATYARPVLSETATDTSPAGALRVHIAVVRVGRSADVDKLFYDRNPDPGFAGQVVFQAGSREADIVAEPGPDDSDRAGLAEGNYVCDLRSGCWYRIQELKDTDGDGVYEKMVLDRPAEYASQGSAAFHNALFVPNVVAVFDGMACGTGSG